MIRRLLERLLTVTDNASHPDPATLAEAPPSAATVTRRPNGRLRLDWRKPAAQVEIAVHTVANPTPAPIATAENSAGVEIDDPVPDQRPIFTLTFADGRRLITAERTLPLGLNFRDIGGYATKDGRTTRWGQIYRAGEMGRLSAEEQAYLQALNVRTVCDLRTSDEVEKSPDRLPQADVYRHLPIYERAGRSHRWLQTLVFRKNRIEELWIEDVYIRRFVEERAVAFGRVLEFLATEESRPAVVHCTAGKDRTGFTIALLLRHLGVPVRTVVADYTLSNHAYDDLLTMVSEESRRMALFGIRTADLFPVLTAQRQVIAQTLAYIGREYGSVDEYLRGPAQVPAAALYHLRRDLLTT